MPWGYALVHAIIIMAAVGVTWRLSRRPRVGQGVVASVLLLGMPLQAWFLLRPWEAANLVGWPDLVFFSELYLVLAAVVVTAALRIQTGRAPRARTAALSVVLIAVAARGGQVPWRPQVNHFAHRSASVLPAAAGRPWTVVRQTAPSSCAPAAAATLLRARRVDPSATEAELAARCLTDPRQGTSDLGLFRGVARSAPGWTVRFGRPSLSELAERAPCLIFVGLTDRVEDLALFQQLRDRCNWNVGVIHAVVLFGFDAGVLGHEGSRVALIGDPSAGYERWGMTHFEALWQGLTLEIR